MRIRQAKKTDIPILGRIYSTTFNDLKVGEKWTPQAAEKYLESIYKKQKDLCLIAYDNKQVLGGFFAIIKPWWDGNHLYNGELFVDTKKQKQGIGLKLSKALYKKAIKKYNISQIDFETFSKYKFPLDWYKKQGFREAKELTMITGNAKEILKNIGS